MPMNWNQVDGRYWDELIVLEQGERVACRQLTESVAPLHVVILRAMMATGPVKF